MKPARFVLTLILVVILSACNPGGTSTPAPSSTPASNACQFQPNGELVCIQAVSQRLDDYHMKGQGPGDCPPGTFDVVDQQVSGTANLTLHLNDTSWLTATLNLQNGVYLGSIAPIALVPGPLQLHCKQIGTTNPIQVTFTPIYKGEVDYSVPPACVFRSRVDFSSFMVTGFNPADQVILSFVKDHIHRALDFAVADAVNRSLLGTGTPLPANADPRCPNWQPLP